MRLHLGSHWVVSFLSLGYFLAVYVLATELPFADVCWRLNFGLNWWLFLRSKCFALFCWRALSNHCRLEFELIIAGSNLRNGCRSLELIGYPKSGCFFLENSLIVDFKKEQKLLELPRFLSCWLLALGAVDNLTNFEQNINKLLKIHLLIVLWILLEDLEQPSPCHRVQLHNTKLLAKYQKLVDRNKRNE